MGLAQTLFLLGLGGRVFGPIDGAGRHGIRRLSIHGFEFGGDAVNDGRGHNIAGGCRIMDCIWKRSSVLNELS